MFQHKCKICRSSKADNIEFARYYLCWSYKVIVDTFGEDIDSLSGYNLSTHFNRHTSAYAKNFWRDSCVSDGIHEPTTEEEQIIIEKIKKSIAANEV